MTAREPLVVRQRSRAKAPCAPVESRLGAPSRHGSTPRREEAPVGVRHDVLIRLIVMILLTLLTAR